MFVVKVPGINGLGKTKGCEKAGNFILAALKEIYSNERDIPIDVKLLDLEEIHLDNSNLETTNKLIYENALEIFSEKQRAIFLGGDHSISYSLGRAFFDHCKNICKEPCLIVFDAHPDCMKPDKEFPSHEEWLSALIERGFPSENIFLVGVRNLYSSEKIFLEKHKIKRMSMNQLLENLEDSCDILMEFSKNKQIYLSIDIDVIDPAFAPGTGYREPGGLTSREFLHLIQRLNKLKNIRAVDLVEINPEKDANEITVKLGAKILSELI
ncbi:arginase family protein [Candidatus Pacearchaeota archaeon]|nr:arginase family protein [Candidatus Pacearchaeota archaeon]